MSPLVDLTFGLAAEREQICLDPMISADAAQRLLEHYTVGADLQHGRLAPRHRGGRGPAPDADPGRWRRDARRRRAPRSTDPARRSGTTSQLEVWPGQMHVFQALSRLVPEADAALGASGALPGRRTRPGRRHRPTGWERQHDRTWRTSQQGQPRGRHRRRQRYRPGVRRRARPAWRPGRVQRHRRDRAPSEPSMRSTTPAARPSRCTATCPRLDHVAALARDAQAWFGAPPDAGRQQRRRRRRWPASSARRRSTTGSWTLDINLWGAIHGCHVFAPAAARGRRGRHHQRRLGSAASAQRRGWRPTTSARPACSPLSETLAAELAGTGVHVTVLCPTFVKTNIVAAGRIDRRFERCSPAR